MSRRIFVIAFLIGLSCSSLAADRYWIAVVPGNWSDSNNWSDRSGDPGGFSVPGPLDKAFFDINSIGDCTMDVDVDVQRLELKADYAGTINHQAKPVVIGSEGFTLLNGTFRGGTASISCTANLTLDGGDFTSTSDTLFISKNLELKSGDFDNNSGTIEFNALANVILKNSIVPSAKFFNVSVDLGNANSLEIDGGDTLWVSNRIDLHDGKLTKNTLVVEDTAYVHAGWDQGDAELTFMGTGNSYYLLDAATWTEHDVFIDKDLALDSVVVKDVDADGFITLGQNDKILEVRQGTLTFEPGIRVDFNFLALRNTANGTIVSTSDTLSISRDYLNFGGAFHHNSGTVLFDSTEEADFQSDNVPTDVFYNVIIEKGNDDKLNIIAGDTLRVENRIDLLEGKLFIGDLVVEDTAYVHADWDEGDADLTFMGTGNSHYLLDSATWTEHDVFIDKDLALDSVIIHDEDADGVITLGQNDKILEVRKGTLAFESGIRADFHFLELRNTTEGTIVSTNDTLNISRDYLNFGGAFHHNSGTVLFSSSADANFRSDNVPTDVFYNVIQEKGDGKKLTILAGDTLHAANDLYLADGKTEIGTLKAGGDVLIAEEYDRGTSPLVFSGSADQTFELLVDYANFESNVTLDKPTPTNVTLLSPFEISDNTQVLSLVGGYLVTTSTEILLLDDGVTWTDASDASFVSGPMIKEGDDASLFPVGKSGEYAPIGISAPNNGGDRFEAEYFFSDVDPIHETDLKDPSIDHVSRFEYWTLERMNGTSDVEVTLSWELPRSGEIAELGDLIIAGWDGLLWADLGNDGQTGAPVGSNGLVATSAPVSVYGAFTFSSTRPTNALPVELLYFNATENTGEVDLEWSTLSEIYSDDFQVQRSRDGLNWEMIDEVQAAGYSSTQAFYASIDREPFVGSNYYRLKQNDFDGQFEYSPIEYVQIGASFGTGVKVYPNPSRGTFTLEGFLDDTSGIRMLDISGRDVTRFIDIREMSTSMYIITMNDLPEGFYILHVDDHSIKIHCFK